MPPGTLLSDAIRFPLEELKAAIAAAGAATSHSGYLQEATEQLSRLIGSDRCSLLVLRDGSLYHGGAVGLPRTYTDALDGFPVGPLAGTCGAAAARGEPVVTPDLRLEPAWDPYREHAELAGLRACWSVPLRLPRGDVLGTFATYSTEPNEPDQELVELASAHASLVALGLDRLRREERLSESYQAVVVALSSALDLRDEYTGAHSTETAALALEVGARLGMVASELNDLERAAVLHDIGKLGIPTDILRLLRPLTDEERLLVEQHPIIGEQILKGVPELGEVARTVRHEHERWDGAGYPDRLAGGQIPLASRIVFACDAWHAMTSDRPYRPALPRGHAIDQLCAMAGSQFAPRVVDALLAVLDERLRGEVVPPVEHADAAEEARAEVLRSVTVGFGADDLFVFRKISRGRFSHIGGVGRGEGWAGNIELDAEGEQLFQDTVATGLPACVHFPERERIVGPYYARSAMLVPCRDDAVVVFGSATDSLAGGCTEQATELAERAAAVIDGVSPAKRLADELEVLEAVRDIAAIGGGSVEDALAEIADGAARALSCEFAAVVALGKGGEPRLGFADRGYMPVPPEQLEGLLVPFVAGDVELPLLVQDARAASTLPAQLAAGGTTAVHALSVGDPASVVLVLAHADPTPRGFTLLCRRVAREVTEAANLVIGRTLAQEELTAENARLVRRVETDALTGVASRAAWDEALQREEAHRARSGTPAAIALFDVDRLKSINDRDGHGAGDELLLACASALAASARSTDLVARIGGDEFAVLLRYTDEEGAYAWCAKARAALPECDGSATTASMAAGVAAVPPAPTLALALVEADRRMYADKHATR